jgi:hypothetical protein
MSEWKVTPNDLNPRYDNYGKGDWNRIAQNAEEYARLQENKEKLRQKARQCQCAGTGYIHAKDGDIPCPRCCGAKAVKVTSTKTRFTYG